LSVQLTNKARKPSKRGPPSSIETSEPTADLPYRRSTRESHTRVHEARSRIRTIAGPVAAVIVVAILLRMLGANPHNVIGSDVQDIGQVLVGPFKGMFSVGSAKVSMASNGESPPSSTWSSATLVARTVAYAVARGRRTRPAV
jgi:DNA-binding transcriptional regulator of glucitol operon